MVNLFTKSKDDQANAASKQSEEQLRVNNLISENDSLFKNVQKVISQLGEGVTKDKLSKLLGISVENAGIEFPMKDGRMVVFDLVTVDPESILKRTHVHGSNDREQEALHNPESLSDLMSSIGHTGNFLPGVANLRDDGDFDVMDGSRRRLSTYYKRVPYRLYVPREQISMADAKYVADLSLLQKALSYREKGRANAKVMQNNGFTEVKELAVYLYGNGYDRSEYETLRVQISAAQIPLSLCELIPDYNNLTVRQYKVLIKVNDTFQEKPNDLLEFIHSLKSRLDGVDPGKALTVKKRKAALVSEIETARLEFLNKSKSGENTTGTVVTTLAKFKDKNKSIKKVTKGESTTFQFKRGDKALIEEIEQLIEQRTKFNRYT
ncbi:hypothetical protein M9194_10175 [Vibrio sp. S4M6]|uniref:ParB family protein n=1 Tax=Vibrio sinus TaxID=2946865 RepID=UPI00202A01EB|nr:ParB family protein [Vibrio sinus]MCL9781793.1 hypothetical protein [Vibrio sinus]